MLLILLMGEVRLKLNCFLSHRGATKRWTPAMHGVLYP